MIWHVSSRNRRIARNLSLVVLLVMLEVAFLFTPTPVTQPARILSPQVNVLPSQPKPQPDLGIWQNILNAVQHEIDSAPHYYGYLPSNIPNLYASGSTIGSSITIPNFVDPTVNVNGSTYTYTTSFGVYQISPALSGATYAVSYRTGAMAAGSSMGTTGFVLVEDHSGPFIQFPVADYGSPSVSSSNTNFTATRVLTYASVAVASVQLRVDFSRTAFPKISSDLNIYSYQVVPSCVPTDQNPCATRTYWNDKGLKDFEWEWVIIPSAGYDQYQSSSQGQISLISVVSSHAVQYASPVLDATVSSVSFGVWFAEWKALGVNGVYFSAINPLTNTPAIFTQFNLNNPNIDPTFGITSTGSTTYPRAKIVTNANTNKVTIDSAQSKFGGTSAKFVSGSSEYLTVPDSADFQLGSGDFTYGGWVKRSSTGAMELLSKCTSSSCAAANEAFRFLFNSSNVPLCEVASGSTAYDANQASGNTDTTSWHTFECDRHGATFTMYFDGTAGATTANLGANSVNAASGAAVNIGRDPASVSYLNGWLDDVFIEKGTADHTSNFSNPTVPRSRQVKDVFLDHFDATNGDQSGVGFHDDVITGQPIWTKATLNDANALISSISFYSTTSSGNFRVTLAADSSGPQNLLVDCPDVTVTVSGWQVVNISSCTPSSYTIANTGSYWIGFQWTFTSNTYYEGPSYAIGGASTGAYEFQAYGSAPNPASGFTLSTENYSEYITYTPSVTQPVTLTVNQAGAPTATFTVSGCGVSPTTIAGDGASHNLLATQSCSLTITVPSDGATSRYRFIGGGTTWSFSTCASGTCSGQTNTYNYQLQVTVTSSGIGGDTTASVAVVNSTSYTQAQLPIAQWWDYNSQASYAFNSPIPSTTAGKQYPWSSISGLSQSLQSNTFSVTTGGTVTATYNTQYDLKIQAADKNNMATILKTTKAAMNVTVNGGSTTILLADANGYMDFGWFNSGTQVYLTAKYSGTVVNSTWHTVLYTVNSATVYQWLFEYNAYVTLNGFSAPSGQATDSTKWNFTGYYITGNSSAILSSGTVYVYYQQLTYQVCSVAISSPSFTVCTATQSLAGPHDPSSTSSVYGNMTDGYVWVRSSTTQVYGVTDTGFTGNPPLSWTTGNGVGVAWSYTNTAGAGSTKLIITNSLIQISLVNPNTNGYLFNTTAPYFNATANSFQSGTLSVNLPGSFNGAYKLRLLLMQKLMNGTLLILDHVDTVVSVSSTPAGAGGQNNPTPVPQWLSLRVDLTAFPPLKVNQTKTLDVEMPVKITGTPSSITITKITINYPWITVTDQLPIYLVNVNTFRIHLHIAPGLDVASAIYPDVQPVFEGYADQSVLWQNVQFIVEVYPGQAPPIPHAQFPVIETVSLAITAGSGAYAIITRMKKAADLRRSSGSGVVFVSGPVLMFG